MCKSKESMRNVPNQELPTAMQNKAETIIHADTTKEISRQKRGKVNKAGEEDEHWIVKGFTR